MDKENLEALGAGILIMALAALATVTNILMLPLSAAIGLLILSPVYWILSKSKYDYTHKWMCILQCIIIIIVHIIITIKVGI